MDRNTGLNPENQCPSERNQNQKSPSQPLRKAVGVIQKGGDVQLTVDFSFDTDRKIHGVAHFETVDRENEKILIEAIERALPQYMQHPILHHQHTERPVGTVTKATIEGKSFYVEGAIYDTPDTDDVWGEIVSGKLNKFSIFGRRDSGSPECKLRPEARFNPCVTKALTLFSISVVGDNAMNQSTFLKVAKADGIIKGNYMEEDEKKEQDEERVEEKADESPDLLEEPGNKSSMLKSMEDYGNRLGAIESTLAQLVESDQKVHEGMDKAEESDEMEETKEESVEKCSDMKKAEESTIVEPDFITKAALDEITKAYLEKVDTIQKAHDALVARVEKMEKETIEKGGTIIVVDKSGEIRNPKIDTLDSIGGVI